MVARRREKRAARKLCYHSKVVERTASTANVTLKLDADLLREARVVAAKRGSSISRLVAEQLESLVRGERSYEAAKRRALARMAQGCDLGWTPPADRAELHER